MASSGDTRGTSGAQESVSNPASPQQRRGGSGRVRGRGRAPHSGTEGRDESSAFRSRGRGGFQPRGRGRGTREGAARHENQVEKGKIPVAEENEARPVASSLIKPNLPQPDSNDPDAEVCFICASPVQHTAVAPCNHRSCHICSIRMRALYKTKACAHCRTESDHVILTDDPEKNYEDFVIADFFKSDDNLGIHFENPAVFDDTRLLLQYNCPDSNCDVACLGWPDLHRHVKTAHGEVMWYV